MNNRKFWLIVAALAALGYYGLHVTRPIVDGFKPVNAYHQQLRGL